MFRAAVLTVSDTCSRGERDDESGDILIEMIKNIQGDITAYDIVADSIESIKKKLEYYCDTLNVDLVCTTGGTGPGPRDVTPEATLEISLKQLPGIPELIRSEGVKNTKNAVLSRGVCVIRGNTLIINFPGSPKGVKESMYAVMDIINHALTMIKGGGHNS